VSAAIETEGLTRGFAHGLAVDRLTFRLEPGQVLALLGPNGAGKTTTVRLLDGVLRPDAGWARVLGLDPTTQGDAVRRRTGVLTENAGLDDRLTSRENLEYVARLRGFRGPDARRRVDELLERFGMADRADDLTQGFSTGQRKRIALARALLHDPEVLFLDGEAGRLADRMAVLHHGRLRAFGAPDDLAAGMWSGVGAEIDLGASPDAATRDALAAVAGVQRVLDHPAGVRLVVDGPDARDVLARAVAAVVGRGLAVYGASVHRPTLEDVYFAIEQRIAAEEGHLATDGFGVPPTHAADPS
jgi:ABC-2 type transport system ATP-binding protein